MRRTPANRVFFFLSAGWGPVVRTLPIINRLVDYGISSSLAVGGAINQRICKAGFDVIHLTLPALDAPKELARDGGRLIIFLRFPISISSCFSVRSRRTEKQYAMDARQSSSQISIRSRRLRPDRCTFPT